MQEGLDDGRVDDQKNMLRVDDCGRTILGWGGPATTSRSEGGGCARLHKLNASSFFVAGYSSRVLSSDPTRRFNVSALMPV